MGLGFPPLPGQIEDSYAEQVGLGQKIDHIVFLIGEQAKETAMIKEELCSLRVDMKELQETNTRLSESVSSTPNSLSGSSSSISSYKRSKIPTQLSVSRIEV